MTPAPGKKAAEPERLQIRPNPGPQTAFLSCPASIAIYGGGAGGGKSWSLLLEGVRHSDVPGFTAVIFRRNQTSIVAAGGLWDQSLKLFSGTGAVSRQAPRHEWNFPGGGKIQFGHLDLESTVFDWHSAEIAMLCFDELTEFSEAQVFYMMSRNRSTSGVRPTIRCSCNPDAASWVAKFIAWWIDQETGYPIPERAGKIRWMHRHEDELVWSDTREDLVERFPGAEPKSVAFFPAKLSDNPQLMERSPEYRSNLLAMPTVERERLLDGNWKIMPSAGLYFQQSWCNFVDAVPANLYMVRYWDLAGTAVTPGRDPDWTVGVKLGRAMSGEFYVLDMRRMRGNPGEVERTVVNTASSDGRTVRIGISQDPGQAGKMQATYYVRQLAGYTVSTPREGGDKTVRFGPFSSQAKAGNVKILRGEWNKVFCDELEGFPEGKHDDCCDSAAGALDMLTGHGNVSFAKPIVATVARSNQFDNRL